jgi:hypothetical protein
MKKTFFLLILFCGFVVPIFTAEPASKPVAQENRFLFIVEDSSAMDRAAKAAQQTVRDLIESGVQGEMHPGDMFSLWTFGETLNATFPVQHWSPNESQALSEMAGDFLKKRKYEKKAELRIALAPAYSLIKASKSITVILISTGTEAIRGTPFDKEINMIYPQYSRELREAKIPFVTVLIGFNGRPVAYSVNSSVGPIEIPQPPLRREKTAPTETGDAVPHTNSVSATNPVAIAKAPKIAKVETKPVPEAAPVISTNIFTPITAPKIAFSDAPAKSNSVPSAPAKVEPLKAAIENATTPAVPSSAAPPPESPKTIGDQSVTAPPVTNVANAEKLAAPVAKSVEPPPSIRESKPEPAASESTNPKPLSPAAPTPVVAAQPMITPGKLLIAGAALLLVAGILVVLLMRHSGNARPSLISHSIDQKK